MQALCAFVQSSCIYQVPSNIRWEADEQSEEQGSTACVEHVRMEDELHAFKIVLVVEAIH